MQIIWTKCVYLDKQLPIDTVCVINTLSSFIIFLQSKIFEYQDIFISTLQRTRVVRFWDASQLWYGFCV